MQEPPEMTVSDEDLRQTEREDTVASLQPLLKEGPYRRDCGVPKAQACLFSVSKTQVLEPIWETR